MDYNSLNEIHKTKLAREAASKYVPLAHAVREYIRITGLIDLLPSGYKEKPPYISHGDGVASTYAEILYSFPLEVQKNIKEVMPDFAKAAKIYDEAKKEMLSVLPKYRHPLVSSFAEEMAFFATNQINATMTAIIWTPLMVEVKESLPEPMCSNILKELEHCEQIKGKWKNATKEKNILENRLDAARKDYQPQHKNEPINARQKRVVRKLGLSEGKRCKTFNPEAVYRDYVKLVRRENFNRCDAINEVAKRHHIARSTALKELLIFRADVKRRIKSNFPEDLQKIFLPHLTGLIPHKEDVNAICI